MFGLVCLLGWQQFMASVLRTLCELRVGDQKLAYRNERLQTSMLHFVSGTPEVEDVISPTSNPLEYPLIAIHTQVTILRRQSGEVGFCKASSAEVLSHGIEVAR